MKITICIVCSSLLFLQTCNPFNFTNTFDSDKLVGRYKVDVMP